MDVFRSESDSPNHRIEGAEEPASARRRRDDEPEARDALEQYMRSIRSLPLLGREEVNRLSEEITRQERTFRDAMYAIPGTAVRALELWRERRDRGRVTGLLCHSYRDDPSHDWSGHIDRCFEAIASLVERRAALVRQKAEAARRTLRQIDERIASKLDEAHLLLEILQEIHLEQEELVATRGTRPAAELRRRLGLTRGPGRRNLEAARTALDARDVARQTFASRNLRLVIKLAKRYRSMGVSFLDLIQEGNLGLMRAVEKFDHTRGFTFSTYAVWWIEQSMIRLIQNHSRTVRVPSHLYDQQLRYRRVEQKLRARLGREPRREELAEAAELTPDELDRVVAAMKPIRSTDEPVADDTASTLADFLVDEEEEQQPAVEFDLERLRGVLVRGLRALPSRERTILEWRFGLKGEPEMTLQEIGDRIGLSRERVRQIQAGALEILRERSDVARLADYLEGSDEAGEARA